MEKSWYKSKGVWGALGLIAMGVLYSGVYKNDWQGMLEMAIAGLALLGIRVSIK